MTDTEQTPPMARPRIAAGALFMNDAGHVLLVQPSYKENRDIPGGYVEPDEPPLAACIREVHEELGIKPPIGRLLVVDWAPNPHEGDKMLFVFDGGILTPNEQTQIRLDPTELTSYQFHPVDALPDLLIPRLARRITLAVTARATNQTIYAEHGTSAPALPN